MIRTKKQLPLLRLFIITLLYFLFPLHADQNTTHSSSDLKIEEGNITGRVIDNVTNLPVANAFVDLMRGSQIIQTVLTDENGIYFIKNIAPKPYVIRVWDNQFQSNIQIAIVSPNQNLTLDFALFPPPAKLTGQIFNINTGEPISNAIIEIFQDGFIVESTLSDQEGNYTISQINSGTYKVKIKGENFDPKFEKMTFFSNEQLTAHFALELVGCLQGNVKNYFNNKPIVKASVGAWKENELVSSTETDENGNYILYAVGNCQIVFQALFHNDFECPAVILSKKTSTLNTTLRPSPPLQVEDVKTKLVTKKIGLNSVYIYTITWKKTSNPNIEFYKIYRNGKPIAKVSAKEKAVYEDKERKNKGSYSVRAISCSGEESEFFY